MVQEKTLISNLKQGSKKAFDLLYHKYAKRLYSFCYAITKSHSTAQDLVQEVFVTLWIKREAIRQDESIEPFLFIIARNRLINSYRSSLQEQAFEAHFKKKQDLLQTEQPRMIQQMEYRDVRDKLEQIMNRHLTVKQKKIFSLSKLEGYSNKEIVELTSLSEQTIKNSISGSLKIIRSKMSDSWYIFQN